MVIFISQVGKNMNREQLQEIEISEDLENITDDFIIQLKSGSLARVVYCKSYFGHDTDDDDGYMDAHYTYYGSREVSNTLYKSDFIGGLPSDYKQIALDRAELHAIETAAWVKSHQAFEKSEAVKKAKESQITLF